MPIYEFSHAGNFSSFKKLVEICTSFGAAYNPTKPSIRLDALNAKIAEVTQVFADLVQADSGYRIAVNERQQVFKVLSSLITRLINALDASDVDDRTVKGARTITRKIHGKRAKAIEAGENGETKTRSVSQMSFDFRTDNFSKLISLLKVVPQFAPNEPDLQIASLESLLAQMYAATQNVSFKRVKLNSSRDTRNYHLYDKQAGIIYLAKEIKKYIKSVFGASSPEFRMINEVNFKLLNH